MTHLTSGPMTVYTKFAIATLVLLVTGCAAPPPGEITVSECSMVFGGPGMTFLGCESGPYVNQTP